METKPLTAKAVFEHALEIDSPAARQAYVDEACADAPELKQKVDALLQAYEAAGSFLEKPPLDLTPTAPPPDQDSAILNPQSAIAEGPGSRIGPYKLLQVLGEGGMGVVYMAEQEQPVRRRVALKIIKPGIDSAAVIARFEAERQALALMDHQNIARVLDAGATASGRPYFVMGSPVKRRRGMPHRCSFSRIGARALTQN